MQRPKPSTHTRLILFSGGVDSTFLLANALRETRDTVLVHHVHLINAEGRHEAEAEACARIVAYCRANYRDFTYTESTVDRSKLQVPGYDVITVASEGGIAAANHLVRAGRMPDFWMLGINSEEAQSLETASNGNAGTTQSRLTFLLAAMAASCYPNPPPKYLRPELRPKAELMAYMGPDLVNLCWTCRRPVKTASGFDECGECTTCKLMNDIRAGN